MFDEFFGRNQPKIFEHPLMRRGVELWLERVLGFYGEAGGVDVEIIAGQLPLTPRTADYIYSGFTPKTLHYRPGSRPELEAVVRQTIRDEMSDREKALALMRRARDNQDQGLAKPFHFYGGNEEELLKRGALMCNELSRLYVCLCQIAGLPARVHCTHISGHMMSEVYTDGNWGWVDSMMGCAPVRDDGLPASVRDLIADPKLFERQDRAYWDDVRPPFIQFGTTQCEPRNVAMRMAYHRDACFHPHEAHAIGNYFVWDSARYTFPWRIDPADATRLAEAQYAEWQNRKTLGWPDHFFNFRVFDEELKMRNESGSGQRRVETKPEAATAASV